MSLASYIESLRDRPEHIRRRHSFWWAFGITAMIAVFWLASFNLGKTGVDISAAALAGKVTSPSQSMVAGVGALGADLWSDIVGPKKVTYAEVQVAPGKN